MPIVKKLTFAPVFLALLAYCLFLYSQFLGSYDLIFDFTLNGLYQILLFSGAILLTVTFFIIFASLAQDLMLIFLVSLIAGILPIAILPQSLSFIVALGVLVSLNLTAFFLLNKLKTYLTFQPTILLNPSINTLVTLLVLTLSFGYYLSINSQINQKGFQIPDSLVESALKFTGQSELDQIQVKGVRYLAQVPSLTPEQIEFLRKNPELLKQYGFSAETVEQAAQVSPITKPRSSTSSSPTSQTASPDQFVKNLVKSQFENLIKPYQGFIAPFLGLIFFISIKSFIFPLSLLLNPLIWLIFLVLEQTKFVKFEKEMREVRKLVV